MLITLMGSRVYKLLARTQIVDFPTRGHNILDIHATNRPSLIVLCNPVPGIGDHEAVFTCSFLAVDIQPSCKRKSYSWAKANWSLINEMAKSFCDDFTVNYMVDTNVDVLWSMFKDFCMFCLTCIPSKVIGKSHDHPWISSFIKRLTKLASVTLQRIGLFILASRTNVSMNVGKLITITY